MSEKRVENTFNKKNVFYIFVKQLHTRLLAFEKYLRRNFIYIQTLYEM